MARVRDGRLREGTITKPRDVIPYSLRNAYRTRHRAVDSSEGQWPVKKIVFLQYWDTGDDDCNLNVPGISEDIVSVEILVEI